MPRRTPPAPPDGFTLHLGRLHVEHPHGSGPFMLVEFWCSGCGWRHRHGWLPEYGLDGITHRAAHCGDPASRLMRTGYY